MACQFPSLRKIYSDNGSNFKGAHRELKEATENWNQDEVNEQLSQSQLEWCFGPAHCGSVGGVWERLIALCKKHIKKEIGNKVLHVDTFETLLSGVMSIMNNRPLTQASTNLDDYNVLSPMHFLFPHRFVNSSTAILPPSTEIGNYLRDSWRTTQTLMDSFWVAWVKEYLESLRKVKKWHRSTDGPVVGQLVLLTDPNLSRDVWRFGRIEEIRNNDEFHPRRFIIKDGNGGTFHRHITGIIPLELET